MSNSINNTLITNETPYDLYLLKDGYLVKTILAKSKGFYSDLRDITFRIFDNEIQNTESLPEYSVKNGIDKVVVEKNHETNTITFRQLFTIKMITIVNSTDEILTAITKPCDGLLSKADIVNSHIPPKSCIIASRFCYLYNSEAKLIFTAIESPLKEIGCYVLNYSVDSHANSKLVVTKK